MSKPRVRGNGTGTAFQRKGETTWTCQVVVGWRLPQNPGERKRPIYKKKGGFSSKRAALNYCATLLLNNEERPKVTLEQVWTDWKKYYQNRIDGSTLACYVAAYKHFSPLHGTFMHLITPDSLQTCMDECPAGKRTKQNMRTVSGLLWRYACDKNIVDRDITTNLYTGPGKSVKRAPITVKHEEAIKAAIGTIRYAEFVYCLCNLGYRPGEFLSIKKSQLQFTNIADPKDPPEIVWYFVHGIKTEAGRNRTVVIPKAILPYILDRAYVPGTDMMFPMYRFDRKHEKFLGFKEMTDNYFRESVFKPMLAELGINENLVPYGARHGYSNKLKNISGSDVDKAELLGHSTYEFSKAAYQSSSIEDLKAIVDQF